MAQGRIGGLMPSYREADIFRLFYGGNMLQRKISFSKSDHDLIAETAETL